MTNLSGSSYGLDRHKQNYYSNYLPESTGGKFKLFSQQAFREFVYKKMLLSVFCTKF